MILNLKYSWQSFPKLGPAFGEHSLVWHWSMYVSLQQAAKSKALKTNSDIQNIYDTYVLLSLKCFKVYPKFGFELNDFILVK